MDDSVPPTVMPALQLDERLPELRSSDCCPSCRRANLDYDGLLNLSCPACGYAVGGCFT